MVGLVVLFAAGVFAESATKSTSDELLAIVPAESLFCVRMNNFDYTLNQVDQFLIGASPMPMMASAMMRMQLAEVLSDPNLTGVNTAGNFAIFAVTAPGKSAETKQMPSVFLGGLIPVSDFQQFISADPNRSQPDPNGVCKIICKGTPKVLFTQVGSFALISSAKNYDGLIATAKSISAGKQAGLATIFDADEAKRATKEPIWAYGNVQQASKTFGALVFGQLEQMKTMMEGMKQGGQGMMGPPAAIIDMYIGMLEVLMKETKSLSIAVGPKANVLNMTMTFSAVPGTDIANILVADPSAARYNKLLGYLEDGAWVNFAGKVNAPSWKKFNDKAIELLATIAGESITAEDIAKWKALTDDSVDALGGCLAFSAIVNTQSKPPFAFKYIAEVKDAEKFKQVLEETTEMMNIGGIGDFCKSLGMELNYTMKPAADSYKGVSIDSAKLVMKSTEPNSPQAQMIEAMYGEGLDYRWAIVDGLCLYSIGGDVDSTIRELIDDAKASGPKPIASEMKAALELLPEADKADFVGTFNYVRQLKMSMAMMQGIEAMPVMMPQIDVPTKSNIAFAGKTGGGKLTVNIALPKEHLTEMMSGFQMMQQQMMQQQMQKQQTPTPEKSEVR
jgi:hypothetical protein